jgi:hypothetical protein
MWSARMLASETGVVSWTMGEAYGAVVASVKGSGESTQGRADGGAGKKRAGFGFPNPAVQSVKA